MQVWQLSASVRLALVVVLSGGLGLPVGAQTAIEPDASGGAAEASEPALGEVAQPEAQGSSLSVGADPSALVSADGAQPIEAPPAMTVGDWMAQIEASLTQVVGVRLETTEAGLQVVLETDGGSLAVPATQTIGNALIADIPNAAIAENFEQAEPIAGIALVEVVGLPGDRVRVAITGTDAPPVAEVRSDGGGLVFGVAQGTIAADEEEAIEIVVTGDQDDGYNPSNATTATRTDTPLRDIPQSITVVPRQVLEDRNVRDVNEAVETVSSVARGSRSYGAPITFRIIRGFDQAGTGAVNFRNGFPDGDFYTLSPIETVERVEVLRGPASVLFGAGEPGGIVNVITRQPLSEPYYRLAFEAGNYGFYQPSIDLSGPLTEDDTVLYRFIAGYRGSSDFQGFADNRLTTIAPSLAFNLGERTDLNLYYEYTHFLGNPPGGATNAVLFGDGSLSPRSFATYYPDLAFVNVRSDRFGYTLEHEFSDSWQLRNNVAINLTQFREDYSTGFVLSADERFLEGFDVFTGFYQRNNYFGQIDLLGEFETGSIAHQVLFGFDFNFNSIDGDRISADTPLPPLDIRNPNYDISSPTYSTRATFSDFNFERQSYSLYLQDQITFNDNFILLIGGRYDWITTDLAADLVTGGDVITLPTRSDGAFSPRIGLVYQPSENVSLYASYTRSFFPISGFDNLSPDSDVTFDPTRGTQYEIGVKTDFLDNRLSATLAAYHLTRTNVLTPDPDNPTRSIQTGEQRSQGVEFDVTGEILPGWNVVLSYAYTDAEVTEDNTIPQGNRLPNVPENQASLWTTYTIQDGVLEGLGFGLGLFYVGARQGDINNSFELGDYLRTDAALYYRRSRFRGAINVRNLFDVDEAALAFSRAAVQRTEPFTIVGSISWEF